MERLVKIVRSRYFLAMFCIVLEFLQLLAVFFLYECLLPMTLLAWMFHVGTLFYLINRDEMPEFKLPWLLILCCLPVIGAFIFMLFSSNSTSKKEYQRYEKSLEEMKSYLTQMSNLDALKKEDQDAWLQANY